MKKFFGIAIVLSIGLIIMSCGDEVRRKPGAVYMPDMGYSRALETYAALDTGFTSDSNARGKGKYFYNARPVPGTIAIGDEIPFAYSKDKPGDSANYVASKSVQNPIQSLDLAQMTEAERLYLVNCAICHGQKLDGNGPLYNGGKGPYVAAPRNLMTYILPEGQMFYSMTYGKNAMGSYASQITTHQRWMIIRYIKSKQGSSAAAAPAGKDSTGAGAPKKDTTAAKTK